MGDFLLRAKHWQIFLVLSSTHVIPWFVKDPVVVEFFVLLNSLLFFGWLALLGNALYKSGSGFDYSLFWFLVDVFLLLLAVGISSIMDSDDFRITTSSFKAHNAGFLPMMYVLFAAVHAHWFVAAILVAIEQRETPTVSQYLGTFVLLFFWPIGIWFIQPRLNLIQEFSQADDAHPLS
ncbi:hypothetical protein E5K00_19805 [Hymenobacter aquaticus]|uniref:Uncharacterized protein n=1 Tax=Hymenobacter aquaticus TaxID=1867101 RepID=A0A4Z0PRH9_9BACT|nr:hypothetical protein [Hymenobacter aquaticus]TGE20258.1 hypothetical protein E5K00_19805 [Hymenobacter aquaticus]